MEPLKIADRIREQYPEEVIKIEEFRGQVSVVLKKERIKEIMNFLHGFPGLSFDYLEDLCGVDYPGRKEPGIEIVYHLRSLSLGHSIRFKAEVPYNDCAIDSVVEIWAGANWHERECFDMFGVAFIGHPDLRRILMPEDWEGFPLKKGYPLQSDLGEREWIGYKEVIETSVKNRASGLNT